MKIKLIQVGKTDEDFLIKGVNKYQSRLKHYCSYDVITIPDLKNTKNLSTKDQKHKEGVEILKHVSNEFVILLDENGKEFDSLEFSKLIQKRLNTGMNLTFLIGGPFGFSNEVYDRADQKIALSQMTFSHQMIRLFFTEQMYRAFSILKGEKYHHK